MSEASDPTTSALLREVRRQFSESLPAKAAHLQALVERAAWGELRVAAHKLHGSCGTYGYASLSDVAAQLEEALLQSPGPPDDAKARWMAGRAEAFCAEVERLGAAAGGEAR